MYKKLNHEDILILTGNIVDLKGENNIKLVNTILKPFNILLEISEDIRNSFFIDDLIGINLDNYASDEQIKRPSNMNDEDFRNYIKAMVYIRSRGGTFDDIIMGLSLLFNIEPTSIKLYESVTPRHIELIILDKNINKDLFLTFIRKVKASGIVLECYKYMIFEEQFEYNTIEYDSLFFPREAKALMIDCKGEIEEIDIYKDKDFEYDRHEYDNQILNER